MNSKQPHGVARYEPTPLPHHLDYLRKGTDFYGLEAKPFEPVDVVLHGSRIRQAIVRVGPYRWAVGVYRAAKAGSRFLVVVGAIGWIVIAAIVTIYALVTTKDNLPLL